MLGDVDGDGIYTIMDVVLCAQYVMGLSEMDDDELFRSDANSDGVIDVLDVLLIVDLVID
jgi:hypothetical protein